MSSPNSKTVGLLYGALDDLDRAFRGLKPADAQHQPKGESSFDWTLAHVVGQIDFWINQHTRGGSMHPVLAHEIESNQRSGASGGLDRPRKGRQRGPRRTRVLPRPPQRRGSRFDRSPPARPVPADAPALHRRKADRPRLFPHGGSRLEAGREGVVPGAPGGVGLGTRPDCAVCGLRRGSCLHGVGVALIFSRGSTLSCRSKRNPTRFTLGSLLVRELTRQGGGRMADLTTEHIRATIVSCVETVDGLDEEFRSIAFTEYLRFRLAQASPLGAESTPPHPSSIALPEGSFAAGEDERIAAVAAYLDVSAEDVDSVFDLGDESP